MSVRSRKIPKGLTSSDIEKWKKNMVAIDCLCDPVKRLLSDFLHVKATHTVRSDHPNRFGIYSRYFEFYEI